MKSLAPFLECMSSIYEQIGGVEALETVVDDFYRRP
jgi:truncated hemoglobin YjbI